MSPARRARWTAASVVALAAGLLVVRLGVAVMSPAPETRRLAPCPSSPNCVSSQATVASQSVQPLAFTGSAERARAALLRALMRIPRTRLVTQDVTGVTAECRSLVFRFVDDLEMVIDPAASVVHVRSASRLGYSDLGVNRRRVERLRALFAEELDRGGR